MSNKIIHVDSNYIITNFSHLISSGQRNISVTETGSKKVSFSGVFGSGMANEVLRISDGVSTIDYTCTETGGSSASGVTQIGSGSNRAATAVVDEFVSKINSSALNITAIDNGASGGGASFTLAPGEGITIIITEDPGSSPRNGIFGSSENFAVITDVNVTTEHKIAPFRFTSNGLQNIRSQSVTDHYKTFIGEHKS
jgi:hypothetical protein